MELVTNLNRQNSGEGSILKSCFKQVIAALKSQLLEKQEAGCCPFETIADKHGCLGTHLKNFTGQ
jgi:hypothetical protein